MASKRTLGCDPELFVKDTQTGVVRPICGLVGGDKGNPKSFVALNRIRYEGYEGYGYLEDGVALEFNVPYATDAASFSRRISTIKSFLPLILDPHRLVGELGFSSYRFSNKDLESKQATTIGCDPDLCAYGSLTSDGEWLPEARKALNAEVLGNYRHVGGHLHFGYDKDLIPTHVMVQLIDALVYLPVLPHDKQTERRRFYGLAGLYREKDYGVEYRTMSNFWLNQKRGGQYTTDYLIATNAFALMSALEHQQEQMAALYAKLPLNDIKALIDSGVSSDVETKRWEDLYQTVVHLPELRTLDYELAKR